MVEDKKQHETTSTASDPASGPPSLEFDAAAFAHFLDDTDWSDEEKAEYIALVWQIVCEFVALGWGVHPVRQARITCGKLPETRAEEALAASSVIDSSHGHLIEKFMRRSGDDPGSGGEGVIDG